MIHFVLTFKLRFAGVCLTGEVGLMILSGQVHVVIGERFLACSPAKAQVLGPTE